MQSRVKIRCNSPRIGMTSHRHRRRRVMITALVQFELPSPITLAEATTRFEASAPKYQNLPGLVRKYYVLAEDGRRAGGVYLWESRQAAEAVYSGEWRERVTKLYGTTP